MCSGKNVFSLHLGTVGQSLFSVTAVQIPNSCFDIEACLCLCVEDCFYTGERGIRESDVFYQNYLEPVDSGENWH